MSDSEYWQVVAFVFGSGWSITAYILLGKLGSARRDVERLRSQAKDAAWEGRNSILQIKNTCRNMLSSPIFQLHPPEDEE